MRAGVRAVQFVVDQAGCESCAARVRSALAGVVTVASISIDEADDTATVIARAPEAITVEALDELLAAASDGSGHTYRVVPGSLT